MSTRAGKAGVLALFFEFVISRYKGDFDALTGFVVEQPIDEFNRPDGRFVGQGAGATTDAEVDDLFAGWRLSVLDARKYLPAARGLLRRIVVAAAGVADERDGDVGHP